MEPMSTARPSTALPTFLITAIVLCLELLRCLRFSFMVSLWQSCVQFYGNSEQPLHLPAGSVWMGWIFKDILCGEGEEDRFGMAMECPRQRYLDATVNFYVGSCMLIVKS